MEQGHLGLLRVWPHMYMVDLLSDIFCSGVHHPATMVKDYHGVERMVAASTRHRWKLPMVLIWTLVLTHQQLMLASMCVKMHSPLIELS